MRRKLPPEPDLLTLLGSPNNILNSQYGRISYAGWCALEARRIGGDARLEVRMENGNPLVAVWKKGAGQA